MTALDIAVIVILALSALLAFLRGMVRETFSLLGWIAGAVAVFFLLPVVRPYVQQVITSEILGDVLAGIVIFIVVLVIVALLSAKLAERVRQSSLGSLDRSLGFLYGLFRGAVLACLGYLLLTWAYSLENQPPWIADAKSKPLLEVGAKVIRDLTPENFMDKGADAARKAKKAIEDGKRVKDSVDKTQSKDTKDGQNNDSKSNDGQSKDKTGNKSDGGTGGDTGGKADGKE